MVSHPLWPIVAKANKKLELLKGPVGLWIRARLGGEHTYVTEPGSISAADHISLVSSTED